MGTVQVFQSLNRTKIYDKIFWKLLKLDILLHNTLLILLSMHHSQYITFRFKLPNHTIKKETMENNYIILFIFLTFELLPNEC